LYTAAIRPERERERELEILSEAATQDLADGYNFSFSLCWFHVRKGTTAATKLTAQQRQLPK
jgi:hypothetical protein